MALNKKKKQINVLLEQEDAEALKNLADYQMRSISQMGAVLIKEGLERAKREEKGTDSPH